MSLPVGFTSSNVSMRLLAGGPARGFSQSFALSTSITTLICASVHDQRDDPRLDRVASTRAPVRWALAPGQPVASESFRGRGTGGGRASTRVNIDLRGTCRTARDRIEARALSTTLRHDFPGVSGTYEPPSSSPAGARSQPRERRLHRRLRTLARILDSPRGRWAPRSALTASPRPYSPRRSLRVASR